MLDRHQVEHDSENTLLHLTSVLSTEDDHLHVLEVDLNGSVRGHTLSVDVSGELTSVVDGKVRFAEVLKLLLSGADQHVAHEQGVVGTRTDDSNLDTVARVPAGVSVNNEQLFTSTQVVQGTRARNLPGEFVNLLVDGTPPNVLRGGLLVDNSLVQGGSTSLLTRVSHQGTGGRNGSTLLLQTILIQGGGGRIVSDDGVVTKRQLLDKRVLGRLDSGVTREVNRGLNSSRRNHFGVVEMLGESLLFIVLAGEIFQRRAYSRVK